MLSAVLLAGCAGGPVRLSDEALMQRASAGPLTVREARVITDNDAAFQSRLKLVEGARDFVDLMYYIYSDDYSSSTLTKALIAAARQVVRVRVLVDYNTNYGITLPEKKEQ